MATMSEGPVVLEVIVAVCVGQILRHRPGSRPPPRHRMATMIHIVHRWTPWKIERAIDGVTLWLMRDCTVCGRNQAHRVPAGVSVDRRVTEKAP
jgi:hypothetical protein